MVKKQDWNTFLKVLFLLEGFHSPQTVKNSIQILTAKDGLKIILKKVSTSSFQLIVI